MMKFFKKYGILILAAGVLAGILYLSRFSSIAREKRGQTLYLEKCAGCHGNEGEGLRKLIPPLAGTDFIPAYREGLPCIIRLGIRGPISVNGQIYDQPMTGFPDLEDDEIKAIIDYMLSSWYPQEPKPSQAQVSEKVKECTAGN